MKKRLRAPGFGLQALAALAAFVPPACKDPYVAPCSVGAEVVVVDARALPAALPGSLVEEAGGSWVYLSLVPRPRVADAGADDAGDGGDAGPDDPDAQTLPIGANVVVVRADGTTAETHAFAAPDALDARRGNTGDASLSFTGDGVIWHWAEDEIVQQPDGRTTTTTTLKTAFVGSDGRRGDVVVPASGTCEECRVAVSFATLGGTTVALVHTTPGDERAQPKTPTTTAITFARDGSIVSETTPSWLASSGDDDAGDVATEAAAVTIETHDDAFVVTAGTRIVLADASLAPIAGPFSTIGPTTLGWDAASREAVLAFTTSGTAPTTAQGPSLSGVFVQRVAASGAAITQPARVTTSALVLAVAKSADRIGVLVQAGAESIAVAAADGAKLAGDQPIASGARGDASAVGVLGARTKLVAAGDRRFVRWSSQPTRVTRTELVCASP